MSKGMAFGKGINVVGKKRRVAKRKRKVNHNGSQVSYLLMSDSAHHHTSPKIAITFYIDYNLMNKKSN